MSLSVTVTIDGTLHTQELSPALTAAFEGFVAATPKFKSPADVIHEQLKLTLYKDLLIQYPAPEVAEQIKAVQQEAQTKIEALLADHLPKEAA